MLRRILMFLLVMCLAAPAVAMPYCHEEPSEAAVTVHPAGHHGHSNAPARHAPPAASHDCIGCATASVPMALQQEPVSFGTLRPRPLGQPGLYGTDSGPDTPPPRT